MRRVRLVILAVLLLSLSRPLCAATPSCAFSFGAPSPYSTTVNSMYIASGDFNSDGLPDIAVVQYPGSYVLILFGTESGGFSPPSSLLVQAGQTTSGPIASGDFNGDGKTDLAVNMTGTHRLRLLYGNGDGTFIAADGGAAPSIRMTVADVNHDGISDVIFGYTWGAAVYAGGLRLAWTSDGTENPHTVFGVTTGDFDGDHNPDIAYTDINEGTVHVYWGNGDGTFVNDHQSFSAAGTGYAMGLESGDLDGDGRDEILVANSVRDLANTAPLMVLKGTAGRTFSDPVPYGALKSTQKPVVADMNHDGHLDVLVPDSESFAVFLGKGDGTLNDPLTFPGGNPNQMIVADFNADGGLDVLFSEGLSYVTLRVNVCPPATLTIGVTPNPANEGSDVNVDAMLTFVNGARPDGMLTVRRDGTVIGTSQVSGNTSLGLSLHGLLSGTYAITATFAGDARFGSLSDTVNLVVHPPPFGRPAAVNAVSFGGPVALSWLGVDGADHYEIWRTGTAGATFAGTSPFAQFNDPDVAPNAAYLYRVRAVSATAISDFSDPDIAITFTFTDETITAGATTVKLAHIVEMRAAIDAVREVEGVGPYAWTNATPIMIAATDWMELRAALNAARSAAGLQPVSFTDGDLSAGNKPIRAVHITELRAGIR